MSQADALKTFYSKDKRWNRGFEMGASLGATLMKTTVARLIVSLEDDTISLETKTFVADFLKDLEHISADYIGKEAKEQFDKAMVKNLEKLYG